MASFAYTSAPNTPGLTEEHRALGTEGGSWAELGHLSALRYLLVKTKVQSYHSRLSIFLVGAGLILVAAAILIPFFSQNVRKSVRHRRPI